MVTPYIYLMCWCMKSAFYEHQQEARERVSGVEPENTVALASAHEDAEGLVQKVTLLEGELAEGRWV
jgi:hypothetical protein